MPTPLPIDGVLPELKAALARGRNAVLVAPPGAGKTTRAAPALLEEAWTGGRKLLLLSPRRIAARAAAARMAAERGERVGETIGFRLRMESRVGPQTRIEVITEGVFARMILSDPALEGVAAVLFDEFHERSLDADLGLALALDAQAGLREDLRLLVMSATLDGARVAALLHAAPVIESQGRLFPVALRYLGRDMRTPIETQAAEAALHALRAETGSALVFLPGAREIERAARALLERAPAGVEVRPLYGALSPEQQDAAIAPAPPGRRKLVLASAIAETSLTIEGVRVVIDSGLSRRPRFDPATGLASLKTVRASRASVEQRAGRAGRLEPGACWRLWDEAETRALPAFDRPEILESDLSGLRLVLAEWGVGDPAVLAWLDPPPRPAWEAAGAALQELGALDADGRLTEHGRAIARLPLPPRLAHMLVRAGALQAGRLAAELAVLLTEPGLAGREIDLRTRLERLRRESGPRIHAARSLAERLARGRAGALEDPEAAGLVLAHAFPDRLAKARRDNSGEYLLASGRGAGLDPLDPLAKARFLVVGELSGKAERGQILAAAPIAEAEVLARFADQIVSQDKAELDLASGKVRARRLRRLGRIILSEAPAEAPSLPAIAAAWREAVAAKGLGVLPEAPRARQLRARVGLLAELMPKDGWPDWSEGALAGGNWLGPEVAASLQQGEGFDAAFCAALLASLEWRQREALGQLAPERFETPAGGSAAIDYTAEGGPAVEVRLQELFGLAVHPAIAGGRVKLTLVLLSPAQRPVQTTADLPGFWRGSYAAVRAELRGRYPKHAWPEDPLAAPPTRGAKRRG